MDVMLGVWGLLGSWEVSPQKSSSLNHSDAVRKVRWHSKALDKSW